MLFNYDWDLNQYFRQYPNKNKGSKKEFTKLYKGYPNAEFSKYLKSLEKIPNEDLKFLDIEMSWFFRVFGFEEFIQGVRHDVFAHVRKQLSIATTGDSHVLTNAQGPRFWVGPFTQQSLLSLRVELGLRMRESLVSGSWS